MNKITKMLLFTVLVNSLVLLPAARRKTIILWDIHGVMMQKKKDKMLKRILLHPRKYRILKKASIRLFRDLYRQSQQKEKTAEIFVEVAHKHNNPKLADMIVDIANTQEPIQGTVRIIRELKENGYTNHIGSNIGPTVFANLQKRRPRVFNNHLFELDKSQLASYKDGSVLAKPDHRFFQEYLKKNNLDPRTTTIIFIDDMHKNVHAAQAVGMTGIHFKNPAQLRSDLIRHGVNIQPRVC